MKSIHSVAVALVLILGPALLAGDDDWRKKPAEQWTEDDARQVLTASPWAQRVKVRYVEPVGRSGGTSSPIPGGIPIPGGGGGSPIPGGGGGGGRGVRTASEITVRWQSSSAVRLAFARLGIETPPGVERAKDSYVIAALAVPEMGQDIGDPDDPTTLNRLRDSARLLVGNKRSVIPDRVQASRTDEGLMVFFIFPKEEIGPLADEKIKLLARIGPANFSAEFKTKEMKLNGAPDF